MPRSYQEFPSLIKPHFFKIFIPELTGTHLSIPPAFLKHIENEKSCRKASLTGPSGNVWNVDLVRDDDGISMQAGWLTFVADNSITPYDFLLFRYEGNLRFTVMIFDMSACEKEAAFLATTSLNFDVPPHYANDSQFPVSDRSDSRPAVPDDSCLPDTSTGGCSVSQQAIPLVKEEAVELPLPSDHYYRTNGGIVKEGLAEHKLPNRISKFKSPEVKSGGSRSRSLNIRHIQVTGQVRMESLVSNRRPVTEEEVKKAYEAATMFKSDHPTALVVMRESYVYSGFYLNFPNSFVRDHLPKKFANMKLWNPNKRLWFVKYVYYEGRGGLSANWGEFSQSNNLELDDVCVFELIHENELQVHIFRVVEELTPLSPSAKKKNPSVTERYANIQNRYQRNNRKDSQGVIQRRDDHDGHQSCSTSVPYKRQQNTVAEKIPSQSATLIKPHFMVTLKRHNLYNISYLRIPSAFEAFDYMRDKNATVLTDVNGKSWTVSIGRYLMNNRCSIRFIGGWLKFCRDNNLEVGDICKFELISEGDVPEMAVEVYKKQEVTS